MSIVFYCEHCGHQLVGDDDLDGSLVDCPACDQETTVSPVDEPDVDDTDTASATATRSPGKRKKKMRIKAPAKSAGTLSGTSSMKSAARQPAAVEKPAGGIGSLLAGLFGALVLVVVGPAGFFVGTVFNLALGLVVAVLVGVAFWGCARLIRRSGRSGLGGFTMWAGLFLVVAGYAASVAGVLHARSVVREFGESTLGFIAAGNRIKALKLDDFQRGYDLEKDERYVKVHMTNTGTEAVHDVDVQISVSDSADGADAIRKIIRVATDKPLQPGERIAIEARFPDVENVEKMKHSARVVDIDDGLLATTEGGTMVQLAKDGRTIEDDPEVKQAVFEVVVCWNLAPHEAMKYRNEQNPIPIIWYPSTWGTTEK